MKGRSFSRGPHSDRENGRESQTTHPATPAGTHPVTHREKCRAHTGKHPPKTKRRRTIPDMCSTDRLYERTYRLLESNDPSLHLTIYRLRDGKRMKPALLVCEPFPDAFDHLQSYYGGGEFNLMIRRGKIMMLSVAVSIAPLPR